MKVDEGLRRHLRDRLAQLGARVGQIEEEQGLAPDEDLLDVAHDVELGEVLDGVERSALAEMAGIREAIARLDAGSYGICVTCGNPIAPGRLQALPAAAECISCAEARTG